MDKHCSYNNSPSLRRSSSSTTTTSRGGGREVGGGTRRSSNAIRLETLLDELQHYKDKYASLTEELSSLKATATGRGRGPPPPPASSSTPLPPSQPPPPLLPPPPTPPPPYRDDFLVNTATGASSFRSPSSVPLSTMDLSQGGVEQLPSSSAARHRAWHDVIKRELHKTVVMLQVRIESLLIGRNKVGEGPAM